MPRPPLLLVCLALAAGAALAPTGTRAAGPAAEAAMDPVTARCVLNNLRFADSRGGAELVREACASLTGQPDKVEGEAAYLVRCKVGGDPEWIEFRLVTRGQCEAAQGVAAAPP